MVHTRYLSKKIKYLSKEEHIINLMIDEIYVKPILTYKGGKIEGTAKNAENMEATTVQTFMLSSVFSKNKDIVAFFSSTKYKW